MIYKFEYKNVVWLDIDTPTKEDADRIMKDYNISFLIANELIFPTNKPRVELHEDYMYAVLHFPAFKHSHKQTNQEIDFIIGKNFVITARHDTIDALHKFSKILEVNSILNKEHTVHPSGFLFFMLLRELYQSMENELDFIDDSTKDIESKIFSGKEKEMVMSLSNVSRTLLNFKKITDWHKDVLESLQLAGKRLFGEHFAYHMQLITGEYQKINNTLIGNMEFVAELRETNNSLLEAKQNEVAKVLTVLAFIAVPLSLIASIFQIDTVSRPIVGMKYDFWIFIGILLLAGMLMFAYFRNKKWL